MRADPASVLSTGSTVPDGLDYRGGVFGELVIVYNPATNSNNVFLALNRAATTAAVTGQTVVSPGQYAFFILTAEDNASGICAIAATGTTVVTVSRQSFRSHTERLAVMGGLFGGAVAAQFWVAISGTQIQLTGPFVEARVNVLRTKTSGGTIAVQNDQGTGMVTLGTGANATLTLNAAGSGNTDLLSSTGAHGVRVDGNAGSVVGIISSTQRSLLDATGLNLQNTTPLIVFSGTSDQRAFIDTTGINASNPAAGGVQDSSKYSISQSIVNGGTIAAGDIVEWVPNTSNRVQSSAAGSTNPQLGVCITGGTGNAGGTVMARVAIRGVVTTLLADAAGVTAGQYVAAGATTANRLLSTAALTANSFGRCLLTAAGGAATVIMLGLT